MHRTSGLSSSSCCFSSFKPDGYFSNDLKTSVRPSNEVVLLNAAKETQTTQRSHDMHNCNTRRCRTSRTASATAKRTPPPLLTDVFPSSRVRQTHHNQIVRGGYQRACTAVQWPLIFLDKTAAPAETLAGTPQSANAGYTQHQHAKSQ
jgi:hypothetical protein